MDAPPVQYVTTSDGYNIAYAVSGEGRPFVFLPLGMSHIQVDWTEDTWVKPWLQGLAARFQLIQYDGRGQGMSTRGLKQDFVLEDLEIDLETLVNRMKLESFLLMGIRPFGHVAIRYAIRHPERVDALILLSCPVTMASLSAVILRGAGFDAMLRAQAAIAQAPDIAASVERQRKSVNESDAVIFSRTLGRSSVAEVLGQVHAPALVLHPEAVDIPLEESMKLAAAIPNARMMMIKSPAVEEGLKAIDDFLASLPPRDGQPAAVPAPSTLSPREVEVLRLVAAGKSNPQIADELIISLNTVQRHVSNILAKTGLANRTEAAGFARDKGLV